METEILKVLQTKFKFNSNLIDGKQIWGRLLFGRWTGVIGHIVNKTSHLAICDISRTLERLKVVDYSYPIYVDELTFMSRSPGLRSRDWMVFSPFNWVVWLCNMCSWVILGSVFYLALRFNKKLISRVPSGFSIAIKLYAIYMGQCKSFW